MEIKNISEIKKDKNRLGIIFMFGKNPVYFKAKEYSINLFLIFISIRIGIVIYGKI